MLKIEYYKNFQVKIEGIKNDLLEFLLQQKRAGKKVAAYGAAAKGNTLLNYCGIKNDMISFVVDANPNKQNKFMPASHIPIVTEEFIRNEKPDFIIILPWNIEDEIIKQLNYVNSWGGKFVVPIPHLQII
jgi:ABC-type Fe3+-hydroxamate transport system substrate-binding protein